MQEISKKDYIELGYNTALHNVAVALKVIKEDYKNYDTMPKSALDMIIYKLENAGKGDK